MDTTGLINGSLKATGVALVVMGGMEVTKANLTGGIILLVAGLIAYCVYEYTPSKP